MNEHFKDFLTEQNFLPYENWDFIQINHEESSNQEEEQKKIRETLKDVGCGVYIYTNDHKEVLYIGEGILKARILRHYRKSYKDKVKNNLSHKFFYERKEKMTVYYKSIDDKYERLAVEAMLTVVLKPSYIKTLKSE